MARTEARAALLLDALGLLAGEPMALADAIAEGEARYRAVLAAAGPASPHAPASAVRLSLPCGCPIEAADSLLGHLVGCPALTASPELGSDRAIRAGLSPAGVPAPARWNGHLLPDLAGEVGEVGEARLAALLADAEPGWREDWRRDRDADEAREAREHAATWADDARDGDGGDW